MGNKAEAQLVYGVKLEEFPWTEDEAEEFDGDVEGYMESKGFKWDGDVQWAKHGTYGAEQFHVLYLKSMLFEADWCGSLEISSVELDR